MLIFRRIETCGNRIELTCMVHIRSLLLPFLLCVFFLSTTLARETVTVSGYVYDMNNRSIEWAKVEDVSGKGSTTTDESGFYTLTIPAGDTLVLRYSCMAFQPSLRIIPIDRTSLRINVSLGFSTKELNEIMIEGQQRRTSGMETMDARQVRLLPDAGGGSIEALLVTFAGVSSNNEMSTQYSVRGGNYDENLVYVNGTEVYRPLLIRAGQQEGLSFIHPEMVKEVSFSSGGFNAQYGDKMSSVLDITYKTPDTLEAVASLSLLGANLYLGHASKDRRFTQIHGFRYKKNDYLLGALQTNGQYRPAYLDYQTYMTWKVLPSTTLRFLGNVSGNTYRFVPASRKTEFGTFNQKYTFYVAFDGQEQDRFETRFGSLSLDHDIGKSLHLSLQSSLFNTKEEENYDITGQYWLSSTPIRNNKADSTQTELIGIGTYHEHARNSLNATVFSVSQTGTWKLNGHALSWGVGYQHEIIHDAIREWEMRDSAGYSLPYNPTAINLVHSMRSTVNMESNRVTAYLQDTWRFRRDVGLFILNGGIRMNHWDFNQETLISPRFSATFLPTGNRNLVYRLSGGVYYQAPFYKELRDTATVNNVTRVVLNQSIKAQKTWQVIGGMDYHFVWVDRPFKLSAEVYYKNMSNLIPYTVDNVRIRYMGRNLSEGYTAGLDMKLFGEFVPGTDSWISLSLMRSRETIDDVTISRPNEQRYNISLFFQDYFPSDPRFTMNLKLIWADGLPFGPPDSDKRLATLRMPAYRRIDMGLSRVFSSDRDAFMRKSPLRYTKRLWLGVDCFNLLNTLNVNSYYWVSAIDNKQWAVPNYLTGRLLNIRMTVEF